jgi:hypothetical protein
MSKLSDEPVLVDFFNAAAKHAGVTLGIDYTDALLHSQRLLTLSVTGDQSAVSKFVNAVQPAFGSTPLNDKDVSFENDSAVIKRTGFTPLFATSPLMSVLHIQMKKGEPFPHVDARTLSTQTLIARHFEALP